MDVILAKAALSDTWVDLATLCGSGGGPVEIDGWWDGVAFERDAVAVAGEDGTRTTENARGVGRKWLPRFLIAAETPAAAEAILQEQFKRFLPIGSLMLFKLGDASKYGIGRVDRIAPVQVHKANRTDEWTHGDRMMVVEVTFNDGALYDETATVTTFSAGETKAMPLGNLPSDFVFVTTGSTGLTLEAYRDVAGSPAAQPYATLTLSTAVGGDTLTINTKDQTAVLSGAPATDRWGDITAGWFFKLGERRSGETQVHLKSSRAGTATHARRWG